MAAMTKKDQFLRIWEEYRKAHENEAETPLVMIEWAKENGLYAVDQRAALRKGAEELAKVLAEVTVKDEDGEEVRINIPFREEQRWLWDDLRTIRHDRMEVAAALGRNRIVGEVKSHAKQLNLYTKMHPDRPPIMQSVNFENDLLDAGIPLPSSTALDQLLAPPPHAPTE